MMKKQLKIWRDDFLRYYEKTSFLMRVVIGAVVSTIIALACINNIIKPQNVEVAAVVEKLQGMEIMSDYEITIVDLKNKQRKASSQLEQIKKINADLAAQSGTMSKGQIDKSMLELRNLVERHDLRIVLEEPIHKHAIIHKVKTLRGKPIIDTRVKIQLPETLDYDSYRFEVLGNFQQIKTFLMDIFQSDTAVFINNIKITASKEVVIGRNFNQFLALHCYFEAHIPYQK